MVNKSTLSPSKEILKTLLEYYQNNQLSKAETLAISITKEYPLNQFAWKVLGAILKQNGRITDSLTYMRKSLELNPKDPEAHNNIGVTFQELGKLADAKKSFTQAILLQPNYIEALKNLGNTYKDQGNLKKAIIAYDKAILINPKDAQAHYNMGLSLKLLGKLEEALLSYKQAIKLNPNYAEAYNNLANILQDKGKTDNAIKAYRKSIELKPDFAKAHHNLSFALLNCGRLKEGLDKYEWRWKRTKFQSQQRTFLQPMWDGKERLNGKKILLWSEQGIGDTIMWASRLSLVTSQAKHCILECQEKLVPLLKRSFPNIEIKPKNSNKDLERDDFDLHLPMGSLYKNFTKEILQNTTVEAYLVPDPNRVKYWKERLSSIGNSPYIGISWKSSNMSLNRIQNYSTISDWSPILTIPNITFINLQNKNFTEDLNNIRKDFGVTVHNFNDLDHFDNLLDVAALSAALDIVISNKTTAPLISAGVGTITKLANWRQSSWNNTLFNPAGSSVDIFERNTWESWNNVFNSIARDIKTYKKFN